MLFDFDVAVIGAGVVGLACARALSKQGHKVLILEQNLTFGAETSSRNSEVIHAGIYYPKNSLKAFHCIRGKELLYEFCRNNSIGFKRCGKLIVSNSIDQEQKLAEIQNKALLNGCDDLTLLRQRDAISREPELSCTAALFSPSTGIIDSHAYMLALLSESEAHSAILATRTPVERVIACNPGFTVFTGGLDPTRITTKYLINSAGLHALRVAQQIEGLNPEHVPNQFFAKGNYFSLTGKSPFSRLIYPVPESAGLGVHYTLDLSGKGRFGPDVEWIDEIDYSVDENRGINFYEAIRKYWPNLPDGALVPAYAGIRPKLTGPEASGQDFLIQSERVHGVPGLVNFFGIESPGLTASMSVAESVASELS